MRIKWGQDLIDFIRGKKRKRRLKVNMNRRKLMTRIEKGDVKLHLGCGPTYKNGWINIDNNSDKNCYVLDFYWNLANGIPIADNQVDFIYHEHMLEHLTPQQSNIFLKDCMRVLKPGGVM